MSNDTSKLTGKQKAFIVAYVANGFNGAKAATIAGYAAASSHIEASRLLNIAAIRDAVAEATQKQMGAVAPIPPKRMPCFLYLMRAENGLIKIGIAANPQKRLGEINVGSPIEVVLLHAFPDVLARTSETEFHRLFASKRVKGEWFSLDDNDIAYIRRKYGEPDKETRSIR